MLKHLRQEEAALIANGHLGHIPYPPIFETILSLLKQRHGEPNFEHLMHALECLVSLAKADSAPINSHVALELIFTSGLNDRAKELCVARDVPEIAITLLVRWLCELFEHTSSQAPQSAHWPDYQNFWTTISQSSTLDVATFNYDTCIELALPNLIQGFKPVDGTPAQRFDEIDFQRSSESRLMHLHGSIRFGNWDSMAGLNRFAYEDNRHDLYYYTSARDAAASRFGSRTSPHSQAGRHNIVGPVITGLQKPDKILSAEPYMSYYRTFAGCLQSSPRLLIVGYGFGDKYINHLLERMVRWHGAACRIACVDCTDVRADAPETRDAPAWIRNGMPRRWTGTDESLHLIDTGMIEFTPWYAAGGMFMLDCAGLLARPTQADEIIRFLTS